MSAWLANALDMARFYLIVINYGLLNRRAASRRLTARSHPVANTHPLAGRLLRRAGSRAPRTGWPPGWADRSAPAARPRASTPRPARARDARNASRAALRVDDRGTSA